MKAGGEENCPDHDVKNLVRAAEKSWECAEGIICEWHGGKTRKRCRALLQGWHTPEKDAKRDGEGELSRSKESTTREIAKT